MKSATNRGEILLLLDYDCLLQNKIDKSIKLQVFQFSLFFFAICNHILGVFL